MKQGDKFKKDFLLSKKIYEGFLDTFKDYNPLHIDCQYARSRGFEDKVMHGNILGGFLSHFIGQCLPEKNVIIHSQSLQYIKPAYLKDRLFLEVTVSDFHNSVRTAELNFSFTNQNKQKIAKGKIQIGFI